MSLRNGVSAAIQALQADDRYKELKDEEEKYGDHMEPLLRFELDAYISMGYKELNADQRKDLAASRDLGYEQYNFNLTRIDYNIEILKNSQKYMAYAQYAGVAKLQSAAALQQEAMDVQKTALDTLKKKYELGAAARAEVDSAEIAFEKAALELNRTKRTLQSTVTSLNKLLGENLETTYQDFDRTKLAPGKRSRSLETYLNRALAERSEILIAAENKKVAAQQASYYDNPYTLQSVDEGKEKAQSAEEAAIEYDSAAQSVEDGIRSAYKQLQSLRGVIAYNESQVESAQKNHDRTQKLYDLGTVAKSGVDATSTALTQAKIQLENSLIDVWLQERKLEIISGIGPGGL
jgi:outer membrane protein TolC